MVVDVSHDKTEVGNYLIANYPPFAFWSRDQLPAIRKALAAPSTREPVGLYLHIPFCRKRCKFCYFRVYTDVNAQAIQDYVSALAKETARLAAEPAVAGRPLDVVYFGGGTPSYLSARQLEGLVAQIREHFAWDDAKEVTFECEPGTLSESKVQAIHNIGVTRLSLGVENFSDAILEENGRAHLSGEIYRAWNWIKAAGFKQVNIDLIAGMVGETWDNWKENIKKTLELDPDCVTIYQMELPFNTRYSKDLMVLHQDVAIAPWSTKRDWVSYAYDELLAAGYKISSAYTLVKKNGGSESSFLYRDALWHGGDLICAGVASFGHLAGVHYQNVDALEDYERIVREGELPLSRALQTTPRERLIRELVLQLKTGRLDVEYFANKFGCDIRKEFQSQFDDLVAKEFVEMAGNEIRVSREGLLRVDSLLPAFFLPEHQTDRYA